MTGSNRIEKYKFVYLLDLSGGWLEKGWYDVVYGVPLDDWANDGSVDVFSCMVSMVLVLWGVGAILGNGYEI